VAYSDLVLADGASNYWRLGETSGTSAVDVVGGKTGTISGGVTLNQPSVIVGNTAMLFDGTTGKIVTVANVTTSLQCSVEAWFKCSNVDDPSYRVIVTNRDVSGDTSLFVSINSNKVYVYVAPTALISVRSVTDGQWHHVVFVSDGTNGWLYLDGILDNSTASLPRLSTSHPLSIGYDIKNNGYFFPGLLDEVAIYASMLTLGQVLAHYQSATMVMTDPRAHLGEVLAYPSPAGPYPQTGTAYPYTYPTPTLTTLAPASVPAANNPGFVTVNVTGTNFTNAMHVNLAGVLDHWRVDETIVYRNPTTLQITLDVRGLTPGAYSLSMVGQDGQSSPTLPFTLT
jgi:hypothetical protein